MCISLKFKRQSFNFMPFNSYISALNTAFVPFLTPQFKKFCNRDEGRERADRIFIQNYNKQDNSDSLKINQKKFLSFQRWYETMVK